MEFFREGNLLRLDIFKSFTSDVNKIAGTLIGLVVLLGVYLQTAKKKQRLLPGVPVVGGADSASIRAQRKRFIHDSKAMLTEGYAKVKSHLLMSKKNLTVFFISVQGETLLCSYGGWRAFDDPSSVFGVPQDRTNR